MCPSGGSATRGADLPTSTVVAENVGMVSAAGQIELDATSVEFFEEEDCILYLEVGGAEFATFEFLKRDGGDLPAGAEVALVRRALLINSSKEVTATNLVESIQLRGDRLQYGLGTPRQIADRTWICGQVIEFRLGGPDIQIFICSPRFQGAPTERSLRKVTHRINGLI